MKDRIILLQTVLILFAFLTGCKTKTVESDDTLPYNPYVEAFTNGKVSRQAPVYLVFTEEIPYDKMKKDEIKKYVKIKPEVPGDFSFENNHTITFKPEKELERNTGYTVTADLSPWFNTNAKDKLFTFQFNTLPLAFRATLGSVDVNHLESDSYDISFNVFTPDGEPAEVVESLIDLSISGLDREWNHSPDGKKHQLIAQKVSSEKTGKHQLSLLVKPNKFNIPADNLLTAAIPATGDFLVYDVELVNDSERYIEVTFTQLVDEKQDITGLVTLEAVQTGSSGRRSGNSETVNIDANKIRIYPGSDRTGTFNVCLNEAIKSKKGARLGETVIREIRIMDEKPAVEFVGKGVIIPQSSELIIPFRSIYLRGVVVRVIRINEKNIGQFLQTNNLGGRDELIRVGRLVARKTIFIEEDENNLINWNTYAVDLRQLMEPEPGAIYRVELSFNRDLSVYPCDEESDKTREQIQAEDEARFKEEIGRYDGGGYYYSYNEYGWWDYDYSEREDPCSKSYYYYNTIGRNVLASDLGIMAKRGEGNEMVVMVHNLLTTYSEKGAEITIHNYQGDVIGSGVTDSRGQTRIRFNNSKPYYIMATQGKQRSYLRVDDGSSLSLSSFDVSGEVIQKGLKGFIYGDRGVWRPGDTLYLSFMLNDRDNTLPAGHPVVMELYAPSGQLYLRKTQTRGELGVYAFDMPTDPDAPTGAWRVEAKVGGVTFHKRLRVEAIKPNRLKISLAHKENVIVKGKTFETDMHVEWLQGATARNLKYEIDGTFMPTATSFPKFAEYVFDDPGKTFQSEETKLTEGVTDDKGDANVSFQVKLGSEAPGMLRVSLATRVYEESGDFSIDGDQLLYSPYPTYVGIRSPQKDKSQLNTGQSYTFDVATVNPKGEAMSVDELNVNVYKVNWYWWWDSGESRLANFMSNSHKEAVKTMKISTKSNGQGSFSLHFNREEWGTYFVSVTDKYGKHSTGVMAYFDWPDYYGRRDREGSSSATTLTFKTDKDTYQPGEKMRLTIPSSEGSRALVSIENGTRVIAVSDHYCNDKETIIEIDVTDDMQPNAYAYVTLLQPHAYAENDLPIRLYGVMPFTVTSPQSYLRPEIRMDDEVKPENKYDVTISEKDGREMAYTLAIVDEGLLDLTRFRTPEPWKAFNAREALGVTSWDLYNHVVGAYGGKIEQIFSIGGDDALNAGPKAIVNRFKPVVQFDGPFLLKKGEKKKHTYTMPNYNGRVRVMVVAGDGSAYGNTEKSVMVRKPVMVLGTLPRIIGVGEEMSVPATVFATEDKVGKVKVSITCSDNMEVVGESTKEVNFDRKDDKMVPFRIRVKNKPGAGKVTITATGKGDKSVYETDIEIRTVERKQVKVTDATLEPGKSWKSTLDMPGEDGTNQLALEVSDVPPVNLNSRLSFLIGYPHGCLEQITSRSFPQLYLKQFAALSTEQQRITDNAVKETIRRLRSYQISSGAFAYWPGSSSSNGWGSVYATHFMVEAENKGYLVPESLKKNSLANLRRMARDYKPVTTYYGQSEEMIQAYRLYVLALAQTSEIGAMNRMKEVRTLTPTSKWMLASAYALIGREDVAKEIITQSLDNAIVNYNEYDLTYGSDLRDKGIRLQTYCLLKMNREAADLCKSISNDLSSNKWFSTQATAYALIGLSEYMNRYSVGEKMEFSYNCDGAKGKINSDKNIWSETILADARQKVPVEVTNNSKATLYVRFISEGIPAQGKEVAYTNEVAVTVIYSDAKGQPIDLSDMEQGTNLFATATVRNTSTRAMNNLVLTEIFPAGWEILNTRFMDEESPDTKDKNISYQDIRDDRVYSYIDRLPAGAKVTVTIPLCAVYPGSFYLPPVYCEAMYDELIRANTEGSRVTIK